MVDDPFVEVAEGLANGVEGGAEAAFAQPAAEFDRGEATGRRAGESGWRIKARRKALWWSLVPGIRGMMPSFVGKKSS